MPKLQSFLPMLAAFIAFVLGMLCLFAGRKAGFLEGCDILTLFTPIGNDTGVRDFYSIYTMSYCEGFLKSDGQERNVTGCFNQTIPFSFDPTKALLRKSPNDTPLTSLGWPKAITGDFHAFALTNQTMSIFYCIGTGVAGIAILVKLALTVTRMPRQMIVEVPFLLASFICLGIASIIATAISFEFVDLINYHGEEAKVSARYGERFLGMTWAAVALLLIGSVLSVALAVVDRPESGLPPAESKGEADEGQE